MADVNNTVVTLVHKNGTRVEVAVGDIVDADLKAEIIVLLESPKVRIGKLVKRINP